MSFRFAKALSAGRARTDPPSRESILHGLLNKRAAAARAGLADLEAQLRSQIRWALPIRNPASPSPDDGAVPPMLLYHFTSTQSLPGIQSGGLSRGMVPVGPARGLNAVWLTTDPGLSGHGLQAGGAMMTDAQRLQAREWSGILPPPGSRYPKEASVRITVDLDPRDRNLHEWLPWARRHLSPEWLAQLHPVAGGNLRQAKTWRLYFGIIPAEDFVAVEKAAPAATPAPRPRLAL